MTKAEAIILMREGKKLTHQHFAPEEWVTILRGGKMLLEDGVECSQTEFWHWRTDTSWNNDWELFKK
jgi:hypothetical protein